MPPAAGVPPGAHLERVNNRVILERVTPMALVRHIIINMFLNNCGDRRVFLTKTLQCLQIFWKFICYRLTGFGSM